MFSGLMDVLHSFLERQHTVINIQDFISSTLYTLYMSIIFLPLVITVYTFGLYWLIPLLYFLKKTNKFLIWILCTETIVAIMIVVLFVTYDKNSFKLSYMLRSTTMILLLTGVGYYKYKHVKRILANG
jgi:hypothetical protein